MMRFAKKMVLALSILFLCGGTVMAQTDTVQKQSKFQPHYMVGTGITTFNGEVRPYTTVGTQLDYEFNDKWSVSGGFMIYNEWNQNHYMLQGRAPHSMVPRKHNSSLIAVNAGVQYNVNDRLSLAFAVYHLGGQMVPWWLPSTFAPLDISVTGFDAELHYKLGKDSYFNFYLSIYRDNLGTMGMAMGPFYGDPWYRNRTMQNPYQPFFNGWYAY